MLIATQKLTEANENRGRVVSFHLKQPPFAHIQAVSQDILLALPLLCLFFPGEYVCENAHTVGIC